MTATQGADPHLQQRGSRATTCSSSVTVRTVWPRRWVLTGPPGLASAVGGLGVPCSV